MKRHSTGTGKLHWTDTRTQGQQQTVKRTEETDRRRKRAPPPSHLINVLEPVGNVLEGLQVGHVVDDDDALHW